MIQNLTSNCFDSTVGWVQPLAIVIINKMDMICMDLYGHTLPETIIASENGCLEEEISFWDGLFSRASCYF